MKTATLLTTAIALLTFAIAPARSQNPQTGAAPQFLNDAAAPNTTKSLTSPAPAREGRRAHGAPGTPALPTTTAEKGASVAPR